MRYFGEEKVLIGLVGFEFSVTIVTHAWQKENGLFGV
jgi:hypothetical protein